MRFGRIALVALVAACAFAGCAREQPLVYSLEWDASDVDRVEGHLVIENDLGYRVVLDRGFLSSHTAQLVECDYRPQPLAVGSAIRTAVFDGLFVAPAYAGHVLSLDPSAFASVQVESIVAATTTATRRVLVAGGRYCEMSYLVARADEAAHGLPQTVAMVGKSLYLQGVYSYAGQAPTRFEVSSTVAYGRRLPLYPPGHFGDDRLRVELDMSSSGGILRIRRRLRSLFHGLDFARTPEREWARRVLTNVVDDMTVVLEPYGPNGGGKG